LRFEVRASHHNQSNREVIPGLPLNKDIEKYGGASLFVKVGGDEYALRSWTAD